MKTSKYLIKISSVAVGFNLLFAATAAAQNSNLGLQVSKAQHSDSYITTLSGYTEITEQLSVSAEVDNTGYLQLGVGYGQLFDKAYVEPYLNYGRADFIDIIDAGLFAAMPLNKQWTLYADSSHHWRNSQFNMAELQLDQREWKNLIGLSYSPNQWLTASYTLHHDRLLAGPEMENDNITSHEVKLSAKAAWVEPYAQYTHGPHRVRPNQAIETSSSFELGLSINF